MPVATKYRTPTKAMPLVKLRPEIRLMADELGLRLFWRDAVLWAGDLQLTNAYAGQIVSANLAADRLQRVASARAEWGTLQERAESILSEFLKQIGDPSNEWRPNTWFIVTNNSLDSAGVFMGPEYGRDKFEIHLQLIGHKTIYGKGTTIREACADPAMFLSIQEE